MAGKLQLGAQSQFFKRPRGFKGVWGFGEGKSRPEPRGEGVKGATLTMRNSCQPDMTTTFLTGNIHPTLSPSENWTTEHSLHATSGQERSM